MKRAFIIGTILVMILSLLSSCAGNTNTANKAVERSDAITLGGKPLTLLGLEIKVGQKAPDFKLVAPYDRVENFATAKEVEFAQSKGKVRLISVVPSLDTPVCDLQTQRFEEEAKAFENVAFYTISMDLPFAQARYCGLKKVSQMEVLSDYRDGSFGLAYGVLIKELRLLTRAIFIVDQNDTVKYVEYVKEASQHPDYDSALDTLRSIIGASSLTTAPSSTPTQTPATTNTTQGTQVSNIAPVFHLDNLEGKPVSLSDFRGKPVLLNFWATWCPFCQAERPLIQQIYDEWQSRGIIVLTVDIIGSRSTETPENLVSFMENNKYSFPVLLDVDRAVTKTYNIKSTPTNFLIDKDGIIREVRVGSFPSKAALEESLSQLLTE